MKTCGIRDIYFANLMHFNFGKSPQRGPSWGMAMDMRLIESPCPAHKQKGAAPRAAPFHLLRA